MLWLWHVGSAAGGLRMDLGTAELFPEARASEQGTVTTASEGGPSPSAE